MMSMGLPTASIEMKPSHVYVSARQAAISEMRENDVPEGVIRQVLANPSRNASDYIDDPDQEDAERSQACHWVLSWLASGNFVVLFGNDGWADERGMVHST